MNDPLLAVKDLRILAGTAARPVVDGVDFSLRRGEVLGLIGPSGSGKTMTALAIPRLLPAPAFRVSGELRFLGRDLHSLNGRRLREVRGRQIALIAQEPASALDPLSRIGRQMSEGLRDHLGLSGAQARGRCRELLERTALPDSCLEAYPHQLSGGMRQRIVIAMALCCNPALVIADEPTTALDTSTRRQILELLLDWVRGSRAGLLLISHEPAVILPHADRIVVLEKGRVLCSGLPGELLGPDGHAGARSLLALSEPGGLP
jgi:ABC-type glutathione transport system ATPase component